MRRWTGFVIFALAIVALAGCAVGPQYQRPEVAVPDGFREVEGWKRAQPNDGAIRGPWWEMFDEPRLSALEEQVNVSNQTLAAAEGQYRRARALVAVARAAYFPIVTVSASVARSLASSTLASGGASPSPVSLFSLPLDGSWQPDLWGRVRRSVEASRASAEASAADLETVRLTLHAELAQDYFLLRGLDAQKAVLDETVIAFRRFLEITENRFKAGVASRADVLQALSQLKSTEAQAIDVGLQRAQAEHAIAVIIGAPASVFSLPPDPLRGFPPDIPVGLPSDLLERRPDIAAAERRVEAANAQIGIARAACFPTVTLTGAGGFETTDVAKWLTWPSHFWSFGPAVAEAIFSGGLRRANTAEARAVHETAVASYRETVLVAFQEVEDNLAALRVLEGEAAAQADAVKAAEQGLAVVLNQYRAGIQNYLNVIVAQAAYLTSRRTEADIMTRRLTAAVLLVRALGGGWERK